jgi:hypothetical protein
MVEKIDLFGNFGGTVHDALREVARTESVVWDTSTGAAVILRHADVNAVAHDPRVAGVGLSLFDLMGIADGPLRDWYGGIMFTNDGRPTAGCAPWWQGRSPHAPSRDCAGRAGGWPPRQ